MAVEYIYSKRYSEQGTAKALSDNDYFAISISVPLDDKYKFGLKNQLTTLAQLSDLVVKSLKAATVTYTFGNGIAGKGTTASPLSINKTDIDAVYLPAKDWGFTQVGNPNDFTLPIAGEYFSVSYPSTGNYNFSQVVYMESNGDIRTLRGVTNGEAIRYVYGILEGYSISDNPTQTLTDIVYRPPGLDVDEHICRLYSASTTAMIGEVWSETTGFKEFVFIILNGTLISEYHQIVRIGLGPITGMLGIPASSNRVSAWLQLLRYGNISAAIVNGEMYIGYMLPPGAENIGNLADSGNTVRLIFAKVNSDGSVTHIKNWTATNPEGRVVNTSPNTADLYSKVLSFDPNDPDALVYETTGSTVVRGNVTGFGNCQASRMVFNFNNGNKVTASIVVTCNLSTGGVQGARPLIFMEIDFAAKTVKPPAGGENRKWVVTYSGSGDIMPRDYSKYTNTYHTFTDHWGAGNYVGVFPNGDWYNVSYTYNNTNFWGITIDRNTSGIPSQYTNDSNFNKRRISYGSELATPTVLSAACRSSYLFNKLRTTDVQSEGGATNTRIRLSTISGNYTDKTYYYLDASNIANTTPLQGYHLNNDRVVAGTHTFAIIATRVNGTLYYHSGVWTSDDNTGYIGKYGIDANHNALKGFRCSDAAYQKLVNHSSAQMVSASGYETHMRYFSCVPIYPGIGHNYALVHFKCVGRRPRTDGNIVPYYWSPPDEVWQLIPYTYTETTDEVVITDFDLSNIDMTPRTYNANTTGNWPPNSWRNTGAVAFDVTTNGYDILYRGGRNEASIYVNSGTTETWWPYAMQFNASRTFVGCTFRPQSVNYAYMPTISPATGIGFVTDVGLGALYAFMKYDFSTGNFDTSKSYIVSSARPADGFNLTVNAPFPIYIEGAVYTIPVQTINLVDISSSYRETTFYVYIVVYNNAAKLTVSKSLLEEHSLRVYIGYITTSYTEITEINCKPITRWENARPSVLPIGGALPVSTGLASDTDVTVWENASTVEGVGHEYIWGQDDIIDTDLAVSLSIRGSDVVAAKDSTTLVADVYPTNIVVNTATWSSSNSAAATVSQAGSVTGIAEGTTVISYRLNDSYVATKTVSVTKAAQSIDDVYFASDAAGINRLTESLFGSDIYVIVKTTGIAQNVNLTFNRDNISNSDLEIGTVEGSISVPITFNTTTNTGIGSYQLRTWDEDEMSFRNSKPVDVTSERAFNNTYTNNTGQTMFISINVRLRDEIATFVLKVEDLTIATGYGHQSNGGGNWDVQYTAIVAPGKTYRCEGLASSLIRWVEWRPV